MLRNFVVYAMISLAASFLLLSCSQKKAEVAEGIRAPKIEIRNISNGQPADLAGLSGKVVFVNFWASWCPPCREEMPSIDALYREMLTDSRFVMITILYKDEPSAATGLMKSNGFTFPVFLDSNGASAANFGVTGVPETYLIDKKGLLRKRVIGPADWNSKEARAYIDAMMSE